LALFFRCLQSMIFFIIPFHIRLCIIFTRPKIGFVFSTCILYRHGFTLINTILPILTLGLFFATFKPCNFSYTLVIIDFNFIPPIHKLALFFQTASFLTYLGFRYSNLGFPGKARLIGFVFSNCAIATENTEATEGLLKVKLQQQSSTFIILNSSFKPRYTIYYIRHTNTLSILRTEIQKSGHFLNKSP
jgi:hypothetical protein